MIRKYTHNKVQWIDLENPTNDEIRQILAEFNLSDLVGQDLVSPTLRSKVDIYEHYIYLILHMPSLTKVSGIQEIDFVIGQNFIITTRYEEIDPLLEFSKAMEVESSLKKEHIGDHAGFVFFYMMKTIYQSLLEKLDFIESDINDTEKNIFNDREQDMVNDISRTGRTLLTFKTATDNHETILESLDSMHEALFGTGFKHYMKNIIGECKKLRSAILSKREYLNELRDTNDSLLATKQNEIMKVFTILAFVTFPLSLIVNILGLEIEGNPILGGSHDFWVIVGITVAIMLVMLAYFKKRKWL